MVERHGLKMLTNDTAVPRVLRHQWCHDSLTSYLSLLAPLREINVQHKKAQEGHHALTSTSPDDVLFAGLFHASFDAERAWINLVYKEGIARQFKRALHDIQAELKDQVSGTPLSKKEHRASAILERIKDS